MHPGKKQDEFLQIQPIRKTKVDGITFNNQMATTSIAISKK